MVAKNQDGGSEEKFVLLTRQSLPTNENHRTIAVLCDGYCTGVLLLLFQNCVHYQLSHLSIGGTRTEGIFQ